MISNRTFNILALVAFCILMAAIALSLASCEATKDAAEIGAGAGAGGGVGWFFGPLGVVLLAALGAVIAFLDVRASVMERVRSEILPKLQELSKHIKELERRVDETPGAPKSNLPAIDTGSSWHWPDLHLWPIALGVIAAILVYAAWKHPKRACAVLRALGGALLVVVGWIRQGIAWVRARLTKPKDPPKPPIPPPEPQQPVAVAGLLPFALLPMSGVSEWSIDEWIKAGQLCGSWGLIVALLLLAWKTVPAIKKYVDDIAKQRELAMQALKDELKAERESCDERFKKIRERFDEDSRTRTREREDLLTRLLRREDDPRH